jgi:hypothetical protein
LTGEDVAVETSAADQEGLCAFDEEAAVRVFTGTEGEEAYTCLLFEDE